MAKRLDIDAILADSRRREIRDLICPACGRVTTMQAHPKDTHYLCDACTLATGQTFLRKVQGSAKRGKR